MFTNENLTEVINRVNLKDKSVLTVASSSDQAFNFIYAGARSIDMFDINKLTEFYFYLKKALIEELSYSDFLAFYFSGVILKKLSLSKKLYSKIKDRLPDGRIREFWDYLFDNFSSNELSNLFIDEFNNIKTIRFRNKYLENETNYNHLKNNLVNFQGVRFFTKNIINEDIDISDKYDYIYLSNILDGIKVNTKREYLNIVNKLMTKLDSNLTEDGRIILGYFHMFLDGSWTDRDNVNMQSILALHDSYRNYVVNNCEIIDFPGGLIPNSKRSGDRDVIILHKKNNSR